MTRAGEAVRIRVPATSANLGPGFDTFGLALGLHDEVEVNTAPGAGLRVEVQGEGAGEVPRDAAHLVVRALGAAFADAGRSLPDCEVRCRNRIPHGRGAGSSAAAIVAGLAAGAALLEPDACRAGALDRDRIFARAAEIEGHPDNVAPCVYGGFTQAWSTGKSWRALRLEPSAHLRPVLCVPEGRLATERARGLLPASVPHGDAAFTLARAALLPRAICDRSELLWEATEDKLHQEHRAAAMPDTLALVRRLREEEGVAAVVSGAGPSVLVLLDAAGHGAASAEEDEFPMVDSIRRQAGKHWHAHPLKVDSEGFAAAFSRS